MHSASQTLEDRKILVVEDDYFIAIDLEGILFSAGAAAVRRVSNIESAFESLESFRPDAALLDLNLKGRRSTPIAHALKAAGIPFLLTTGYSRSQITERFLDDVPLVGKPVQKTKLLAALHNLFARQQDF